MIPLIDTKFKIHPHFKILASTSRGMAAKREVIQEEPFLPC